SCVKLCWSRSSGCWIMSRYVSATRSPRRSENASRNRIILSFWPASNRPTMPKSMSARRPSSVSRMLPGCGSQWNTPSIAICFMYADSRSAARAFGFDPEVQLLVQARCELVHHLHQAVTSANRGVAGSELRDFAQHLQVDLDALTYPRPLDFDCNFVAVAQDGAMHLRHRCS